jgi:Lsr2
MKPLWRGHTVASRTITLLQDDIDGSNATQTVRFAIDGTEYEIDLSDRKANRLRNSFAEFVERARTVRADRALLILARAGRHSERLRHVSCAVDLVRARLGCVAVGMRSSDHGGD